MDCPKGETVREHWAHGGGIDDLPSADEDLTTPEHLLHLPRLDPERLATGIARGAVQYLREPENLAAVTGATLLPLIVFRGRRPPFIPWLIVALMGDRIGVMAWRAHKNLETIARAAAPELPRSHQTPAAPAGTDWRFASPPAPGQDA
jgi:hypothetical protein